MENKILTKPTSIHTSLLKSLFQKNSLSKFLSYMAFNEDGSIFINNDGTKGVVFEVIPRIIAADASVFEQILFAVPENVYIQFMLYGSPNVFPITNEFVDRIDTDNEIYRKLAEDYAEFIISRTKKSIAPIVPTRVKNNRLFVSLKFNDDIDYKNIISTVENTLSVKQFYPRRMNPRDLIGLLFEIFNMNHNYMNIPYNEHQFIGEQILAPDSKIEIHEDYIISDGVYWGSLNVADFPAYTHLSSFSQKLGDSFSMNLDRLQFFEPYFITHTLTKITPRELNKIKASIGLIMQQQLPEHMFPRLVKKQVDAAEAIANLDDKKPLLKSSLSVLISGKSEKDLISNADTIISYWGSGDQYSRMKVFRDKYIVMPTFIASLPMGVSKEYLDITNRYNYFFSDEATHFIPAESDWQGTADKTILLISRRGQLIGFDLFNADSYNGYIVASTGAGKSVFINLLVLFYLSKGNNVWIFDIGRSYEKLAKATDGQWIEFNPDNPVSLNPFSSLNSQEEFDEYLEYLTSFIYFIGAPISRTLSDEQEKLIKSHLGPMLQSLYKMHGNQMSIDEISRDFIRSRDPRLSDFGQQLHPFTSEGMYGKFFSGPSNINFDNKLVVMELDALENIAELRDAVIMMMVFHISKIIYKNKTEKRALVFIDEAHKFIGTSAKIDIFIEQAYRRFRKHGASMIIATQGLNDIFSVKDAEPSKAGRVILENSAWKFFLKQTPESINILSQASVLPLSDFDKAQIKSIRNSAPSFSEVYIITPFSLNVPARIYLSPFIYYLFTTKKEEKELIARTQQEFGLSLAEAISKIIHDNEYQKGE
jgi:conjugal transfer ATP-binding protein TraC